MSTTVTDFVPATEAQVNLIAKLVGQKDLTSLGEWKVAAAREVASGTRVIAKTSASLAIKEMLALPNLVPHSTSPAVVSHNVPAGRYAIDMGEGVKFYVVDVPTEGRWTGYTFVKVQASDDLYPVKQYAAKNAILKAIAANPAEASLRYGQLLGSCGVCGRTLTDETSRARGIGPICADKTGW